MTDDIKPVLRVGIAMGEVVVADDTVTGEAVVMAQRLGQLAEPGGVCIQGMTKDTIPKTVVVPIRTVGSTGAKGF